MRWTYQPEMELLLRAAGFARWQILGDFDGRPLEKETDTMIVQAWSGPGPMAESREEGSPEMNGVCLI
jgi:hypothetical protein